MLPAMIPATLPIPGAPVRIGDTLEEIETPALLVDLDHLETNIARMAKLFQGTRARLRPHAKAHKCPAIAHLQLARGAVGFCCQTVGEAEVLVVEGITDVLVTNQIVDPHKLDRLAALSRRAAVAVCVDHPEQVHQLEAACVRQDSRLGVLVEVDVGGGRCGVPPGSAAANLAERIAGSSRLHFAGLQAYNGKAQHLRGIEERRAAAVNAAEHASVAVAAVASRGLVCESVTGGGTGTFLFDLEAGLLTEIQAGSYALMDADYARNQSEPRTTFTQALQVLATVISRPAADRAVIDAGLKAIAFDSGPPEPLDLREARCQRPSDEHCELVLGGAAQSLSIGQKLRLAPGHCDPTINLHDWLVAVRGDRVEALWPIAARGYRWPGQSS